jgi:16S rRNA processing protein RimM
MRLPLGPIAKLSSKSSKKSNHPDPARLIPLGRVVNTHGVRGEIRLLPYAFPCQTLAKGLTVFLLEKDGEVRPYTIVGVRSHRPFVLLKLETIDSLERAETLREKTLAVEESVLPPVQDGEYYYYQVIGLSVRTTAGREIGVISQVFFSGGHDIWVVQEGKKEYLIPVTEEIVRVIDIPGGHVVIEPLDGLLD